MRLEPFDPAGAPTVSSWAHTAEEALAWCSRSDVPVPPAVIAGWAAEEGVAAFALLDHDDTLVGYGEMWVDDDEGEVELARLIIEPGHRGTGCGRRLVTELVRLATEHHPLVVMRVRPDNVAALKCYAAAGFAPVTPSEQAEWNVGQPVAYAWMSFRAT